MPADDPSRKKLGAYLVNTQFQGSVNSSAMFLTAAAQNLLCMKLATELGVVLPSAWVTWFKAAVVPALLGLLITPVLMYKIFPPEIKNTPEVIDAILMRSLAVYRTFLFAFRSVG